MKAIILASGEGKRLMPLTKKTPKPLIEISGGLSILERIMRSLTENNINDIIITTGHLEKQIGKFIKNKYPKINITYVENPVYDKTNYIYSLWLARKILQEDDIILMHGDLVYDFELMKRIINEDRTCVLIKKGTEFPKKDFKARIKNNLITEIGVDVSGKDARFCAPLYKFLKHDFKEFLNEIENFIMANKVNCYAEDAFNKISDKIKLYPVYYDKEFCMEIDDFDDLEKAKNLNLKI